MRKITTLSALAVMPALIFAGNPVKSQLGFRENKGQVAGADGKTATTVLFKTTGTAPGIFVTTSGITYVFYKKEGGVNAETAMAENYKIHWSKIDMLLQGAVIKPENVKVERQVHGLANFYYPHCPDGILGVKTWQHVTIANVYPGIDWVLNADDEKGLSYDFIVHPGADASKIGILYKGASSINILENKTKLVLHSTYGDITEGALNIYQADGKKVEGTFKVHKNELKYSIGSYDPHYELIIDPPLQWSVKELSSGLDYGNALVCPRDGTGNVIITGFSGASDFPTLNAYQGTHAGNDDMVIFRLNGAGTMLWSTYYGGSNNEWGKGIGADLGGNCYVAGFTSSTNFPTQGGVSPAFQGGTNDVAFLKLDNAGVRQWASYYGSTGNEQANALVADAAGNSYLTGYTNSANFPTVNPIQAVKNNVYDAFVMKLNTSCAVQWATFCGGDDEDKGRGITLDPNFTNVFVTGTSVGQFSVTAGAFQINNASIYSSEDGFVMKMSASSGAIQYSTFVGSNDADIPEDIAVDNAGNAYVTGYTFSSAFPVFNPGGGAYVDSTHNSLGMHDAFVFKVNPTGTALPWSTHLGGSGVDMGLGICYDVFNGIYVTGASASTDFPTMVPADNVFYQGVQGDGGNYFDFFIAWFTPNGAMQWNTYYGDDDSNEGRGLDTDPSGNIYVCGADSNNIRVLKFAPAQTTGVASYSAANSTFKLYPVPAQSVVTIETEMEKGGIVSIEIWNAQGSLVRKEVPEAKKGMNTFDVDVSALPAGSYILKLTDAVGETTRKFVKEK